MPANWRVLQLRWNTQNSALCPELSATGRNLEAERAEVVRGGGYRAVLSGIGGDEFMGGIPDPARTWPISSCSSGSSASPNSSRPGAWSSGDPGFNFCGSPQSMPCRRSLGQYLLRKLKSNPWIRKDFAKRTRLAIRQLDVDEHFGLWLPTRRSYIGGVTADGQQIGQVYASASALEEARYPLPRSESYRVHSLDSGRVNCCARRETLPHAAVPGWHRAAGDPVAPNEASRSAHPCAGFENTGMSCKASYQTSLSSGLGYVHESSSC